MTDLTEDEIKQRAEEIVKEAVRQKDSNWTYSREDYPVATLAVELALRGWKPVDPDVLAVRELLATRAEERGVSVIAEKFRKGWRDTDCDFQTALAAYKLGANKQAGGAK